MRIIYDGIFFNRDEIKNLAPVSLDKIIENPHITFHYFKKGDNLLTPIPNEIIGEKVRVKLTHFGISKDGKNAGFRVELPEEVVYLYDGVFPIHVTTSIALDGKAVDTAQIESWEKLDEPIVIEGIFDYFKR